jgi:hypothetical protein
MAYRLAYQYRNVAYRNNENMKSSEKHLIAEENEEIQWQCIENG